jgi:hypothetical protein
LIVCVATGFVQHCGSGPAQPAKGQTVTHSRRAPKLPDHLEKPPLKRIPRANGLASPIRERIFRKWAGAIGPTLRLKHMAPFRLLARQPPERAHLLSAERVD